MLASTAHGIAPVRVSPELGNVCFMSSLLGFCFSLQSFARLYAKYYSVAEHSTSQSEQQRARLEKLQKQGADADTPASQVAGTSHLPGVRRREREGCCSGDGANCIICPCRRCRWVCDQFCQAAVG